MGDVLNANPTVYDVSLLPTRQPKSTRGFLLNDEDLSLYSLSLSNQPGKGTAALKSSSLISVGSMSSSSDKQGSLCLTDSESDQESDFEDDEKEEEIDALEVYDLIANISDPEHPLSLAALGVVNLADISISYHDESKQSIAEVVVKITPTINHCSLATLIGLGIRVRLERCLPPRFRILILLKEGSHQSENQVNKQLNDKERISAACENGQLLSVIANMLSTCK